MVLDSLQNIAIQAIQLDQARLVALRRYTPVELFEYLALQTWERLRLGKDHHVHQGEETITDINLLQMRRNFRLSLFISSVGSPRS